MRKMKEIYLDNSATTRVDDRVVDIMTKVMKEDYGNPSSKHMKGVESERYLTDARETIARILKADPKEIVFTSGGTESNNMALIGAAIGNRRSGKHIITTAIEHASVMEPLKYLRDEGFEITYLPVDSEGHISLENLKNELRPDTILVSVMLVNNEIGSIQDVAAAGKLIKETVPSCLFHVDAIQAFGKMRIFPAKMNIDLMSVSGHKFHGPKGVGFLYIRSRAKVRPLILGGGQQKGMRSGTDNVPGIAGLAAAAQIAYDDLDKNTEHMKALNERLSIGLERLGEELKKEGSSCTVIVNSHAEAPHIVSCTFSPVKSEVLLHALEEKGIYVSSGSACSSNKPGLSGTLQAIGLSAKEADSTIRFSFCRDNTAEEVDAALDALKGLLPVLSRFVSH